ncbi:hypothetical protein CORT_0A04030 [Candida orthopsilosis Co 90-125]|uniref:Uncharacterized protein n=1 Tax=Candida orthopsilosis (strain 90-125) TaxID=1136231 RepID=H8WWG7_CANO9|nr:hypothetical protein CORT_0A04030 [Candida orthopsilosis Co 90-125]CCG20791.1 hypothetical protein CORT_0A04030 [Candida orthopsilosis Co 90-125]
MSGSLSTRVMNMKFMQKAENTKANENHEEQRRMLDDVSEWMLPHSAKILKMAQRKPKIEVLGYGFIMNDRSYTTRKSWTNEKDVADSDDYDPSRSRQNESGELSTLWRKRKPDGSPNRDNKRRAT